MGSRLSRTLVLSEDDGVVPDDVRHELAHAAQAEKERLGPCGGWVPKPRFLDQLPSPVIEVGRTPGTEDVRFGFEGGKVVQDRYGVYWLFTAEMFRVPVMGSMRVALWKTTGTSMAGPWVRHSTIAESNQSFPLVWFAKRCNDPWCPWQGAVPEKHEVSATYQCNTSDLLASPWAPIPVFDAKDDHWHVLFVGYTCDFSQLVMAGAGNIFGARSAVPGEDGIAGPYRPYGALDHFGGYTGSDSIVLGPNASTAAGGTVWGDVGRTTRYVDEMAAFSLGKDKGYAAFVSVSHHMAWSPHVNGPWTVEDNNETFPISTKRSAFTENPIVNTITTPTGELAFGATFDTVFSESYGFGWAYSQDGQRWGPEQGIDIVVPYGVRTPLGLVEQENGEYTLLFTRRFPKCEDGSDQAQADNSGGFGAAYPTMCAHVYAARFSLVWRHRLTHREIDSRDMAAARIAAATLAAEVKAKRQSERSAASTHTSCQSQLLLITLSVFILTRQLGPAFET